MMKSILIITLAVLWACFSASLAAADQTSRCHCYRDRAYNPKEPFAADSYLLTTTFNSLIATTLNISKRDIIMMKMKGGIDPDNLLIALFIAQKNHSQANILLSVHDNGGSWQSIVRSPSLQNVTANDPILSAISKGMAVPQASEQIADKLIVRRYRIQKETIEELHRKGMKSKEIALLIALHKYKNISQEKLTSMKDKKGMSWSAIANSLDLSPSAAGKMITRDLP